MIAMHSTLITTVIFMSIVAGCWWLITKDNN